MAVGEGKFALYSSIQPPLPAGDYRLTARQNLNASNASGALGPGDLPVAELPTHLRVRSPRFALPPEQVLSTFPPANSFGSYGLRLAQIVIKRRTLPWERALKPSAGEPPIPDTTPWLALVLIAEGEAELKTNQPVADCITPGVVLDGVADVEKGSTLIVRRSIVDKVFPTRLDVPLLAHAREVDINDTELMMGDDDGFLAVVVSNRLPLAGQDTGGGEAPIKYLACLVNLEGQFDVLLPKAPDPAPFTHFAEVLEAVSFSAAGWDQMTMGRPLETKALSGVIDDRAARPAPRDAGAARPVAQAARPSSVSPTAASTVGVATGAAGQWSSPTTNSVDDVYVEMARPFSGVVNVGNFVAAEPIYRFPVLLHWSFTSSGDTTFQKLMEEVDAGLLGTVAADTSSDADSAGRPPVEVVETGHVGLAQRTLRGDEVRAWYRGPFVPHPTADPPGGRLPLAHTSDQLRIIVPDGREDLSLAGAFEIGRLLALARPSMVAALLRWRQLHYQAARRGAIWDRVSAFLGALDINLEEVQLGPALGISLGRSLARSVSGRPDDYLGAPRQLVAPGVPVDVGAGVIEGMAAGLGVAPAVFRGDTNAVLGQLRVTAAPVVAAPTSAGGVVTGVRGTLLSGALDKQLVGLVADAVPGSIAGVGLGGGAFGGAIPVIGGGPGLGIVRPRRPSRGRAAAQPDALDLLLEALNRQEEHEEQE
jgi:hypothetical protein